MSAKADDSSRGRSTRWVPLSYPSGSIFSSLSSRNGGNESVPLPSAARVANPFFPLHQDVLFAAVREFLIIDGKIDYRSMDLVSPRDMDCARTICKTAGNGDTATAAMNLDTHSSTDATLQEVMHCEDHKRANLSDGEGVVDEFPSMTKRRIRNTSTDSLPTLHEQKELFCPQAQPHIIPNVEQFDYARFRNAEALVSYVVDQAISHGVAGTLSAEHDTSLATSTQAVEKQRTEDSLPTSKRKVSDADGLDYDQNSSLDFPSEILSLVRSNIMILQTTPSETVLTKLATHSGIEFLTANATKLENTDHSILSFLRNPKMQREQQSKSSQTRLFLPQLLEVSIDDECSLRAKARRMISSMVTSIPGNDMNKSLRIFLGYRSSKTPTIDRILDIVSDVLFDVSHAMYAWIHTHDKLLRTKGTGIADGLDCSSANMQIKAYLFDDRALKQIGVFEPESLLPLALGIRHCRLANISWERYATSKEGRVAMRIHSTPQVEFLGDSNKGEETCNSRRRKRQTTGTINVNNSLIELGRKRRGRRGKCIQSSRL